MLTHEDLAHVEALWTERVGPGYSLEVQIVGEHGAEVDQDRPLGVKVTAKLSLRLLIYASLPYPQHKPGPDTPLLFDETIPYDREALMASVRALSGRLMQDG